MSTIADLTPTADATVDTSAPDFAARELLGTVRQVRPFDGWAILSVEVDDAGTHIAAPRSVIGEWDADDMPALGCRYRFFGVWTQHDKWGPQFRASANVLLSVQGQAGTVAYLSRSGLGITPLQATRLWRAYGLAAVDTLRTDPARVAADGLLPADRARDAATRLSEDLDAEPTKIALFELFASHGIPRGTVKACIATWGAAAPAVIRRDPFCLLTNNIPGIGFKRADSLYLSLGLNPHRLKRQMLAGWHGMKTSTSGDTWETSATFLRSVLKAVGGMAAARFEDAIRLGVRAKWLMIRDRNGETWIAERRKATDELELSLLVTELLK